MQQQRTIYLHIFRPYGLHSLKDVLVLWQVVSRHVPDSGAHYPHNSIIESLLSECHIDLV